MRNVQWIVHVKGTYIWPNKRIIINILSLDYRQEELIRLSTFSNRIRIHQKSRKLLIQCTPKKQGCASFQISFSIHFTWFIQWMPRSQILWSQSSDWNKCLICCQVAVTHLCKTLSLEEQCTSINYYLIELHYLWSTHNYELLVIVQRLQFLDYHL